MSLFSWFTRKSKPQAPRPRQAATSAAPLTGAAAPAAQGRASKPLLEPSQEQGAARKNERMERRELLYTVVRDAMVRAGVLSAGYKFKVLSLDQRGAQFLVMMDLAQEYGGDMPRLRGIESQIVQAAKARFDILVTAVYWRTNDQVATAAPPRPAAAQVPAQVPAFQPPASPIISAPPSVAAPRPQTPVLSSRPAPLVPPAPPAPSRTAARFEPIEADEVAAFKQALVSAAAVRPVPAPAAAGVTTRSGPLLPQAPAPAHTGFEDTVMPGQEGGRASDLSSTQYGELN